MFEDMVAETYEVMDSIISAMSSMQDPMRALMDKFNDEMAAPHIVYHMRLLASSCLKANIFEFEPFLDGGVDQYINGTIMPVDQQIDHMGVRLLFDILLKPANMVLDIAYLDRSEGDAVNTHRMPDEANGQDPASLGPLIYLLYRPGHYDILYRDMATPPVSIPTGPTSLQVHRVDSLSHQADVQNTMPSLQDYSSFNNMDALAMLPSFDSGLSPIASPHGPPPPMVDPFSPSPQPAWMQSPFPEAIPAAPPSLPSHNPSTPATNHPLRFSKYNFPGLPEMADTTNTNYEPTFTTNTFKNSHFNTAHYSNNNFQPEMYNPDAEEIPMGRGSGGRKRSG